MTINISAERLWYWDTQQKQYVVALGAYEFPVGAASNDIKLKLPLTITAR